MSAPAPEIVLFVTGGRGQLGADLALAGAHVRAVARDELDITDPDAVTQAVAGFAEHVAVEGRLPVVCNAAAYTAVDQAESDVDAAYAVNARGAQHLADACRTAAVPLLHVSTDYVFSGDGTRPYTPEDATGPRSVYGQSKLAGEHAVLDGDGWVVRTSWLYGAVGGNFVKTMARLSVSSPTLSVVDDQTGSPTYSADLARALLDLASAVSSEARATPPKLLHATGGGGTTWYSFARAVFTELGADPGRIAPCGTELFSRPAPRPAYSVLSNESWRTAGLTPLRHWRDALSAAFATHRTELSAVDST